MTGQILSGVRRGWANAGRREVVPFFDGFFKAGHAVFMSLLSTNRLRDVN